MDKGNKTAQIVNVDVNKQVKSSEYNEPLLMKERDKKTFKKENIKKEKTKEKTGKIVLLPCSNCSNKTVVYPCSCNKVAYCGPVCQVKYYSGTS